MAGFLDFVHRPVFRKVEKATFHKLDLFPFAGEGVGTHTLLGRFERIVTYGMHVVEISVVPHVTPGFCHY
jgi:hypothetical protein